MNQCLVKQLKATVNNPNLPILETMQQITLDAIALSGNNTMTNEQKYVLNHFFYQVGAVSNSSLWNKIQMVILPFLANDAEHSIAEYKSNSIYAQTLASTFLFDSDKQISVASSGGTVYYQDLFEYDFESDNFSVISLIPTTPTNGNNGLITSLSEGTLNIRKANSSNTSMVAGLYNTSGDYVYRYYTTIDSVDGYAFSFGHESNLINGLYLSSGDIVVIDNKPIYNSENTYPAYSNSILRISNKLQRGFVVGKAMTAEELNLVFTSLINLRAAFVN